VIFVPGYSRYAVSSDMREVPLKVLCIDHGAILRSYRERYVAIANLADIDLIVIVPRRLNELNYDGQRDRRAVSESKYKLICMHFVPAKVHRGLYDPYALAKVIGHFQPDIIHLQGEPETLSSVEVCLTRNVLCPQSKLISSSWANINLVRTGWPYKFAHLYNLCYRFVLDNAQGATTYGKAAERILLENGFKGRVKTIPWGVDPRAFRRLEVAMLRSKIGLEGFVVGYVGRLEWAKGVHNLIEAMSGLPVESCLLMVGEGPAKSEWMKLAQRLGVGLVSVGAVSNQEIAKYLNCLDLLVLPSLTTKYWKEQFGKVLIEAMACEVPVIGSNSGEIPNVIADAGLVFVEGDSRDLRVKLELLVQNPDLCELLAKKGRSRVLERYSWESVAHETMDFYAELVNGR